MRLRSFMARGIFVTACIATLLYAFYPRYEFENVRQRYDKVSGRSEVHVSDEWVEAWN